LPLSGCLMHCWYAGVDEIPSFIAASLSYCKSVVGYLVAGESSPRITSGWWHITLHHPYKMLLMLTARVGLLELLFTLAFMLLLNGCCYLQCWSYVCWSWLLQFAEVGFPLWPLCCYCLHVGLLDLIAGFTLSNLYSCLVCFVDASSIGCPL